MKHVKLVFKRKTPIPVTSVNVVSMKTVYKSVIHLMKNISEKYVSHLCKQSFDNHV